MKKLLISLILCCLTLTVADAQIQFHQPVGKQKKDKKSNKKTSNSVLFRQNDNSEQTTTEITEIPAEKLNASHSDGNDQGSQATAIVGEQPIEIPATSLPHYNEAAASNAQQAAQEVKREQEPSAPASKVARPFNAKTISVILPFNLASASTAEDKMQMRSVEFYQGFLIAVEEAQRAGQNLEIATFDIGSVSISGIITDERFLRSAAVIAPMETNEIIEIAKTAKTMNIPVISPFKFCKELVDGYPHVVQLNTSKTTIYDILSKEICNRFDDYSIVFVKDSLFASNIDAYPRSLKQELDRRGKEYYSYTYNEPQSVASMDTVLNLCGRSIMYVLETPNRDALRRFFPSLKNKLFLENGNDTINVSYDLSRTAILGYPEWQTYTSDFMDYFYDLNVWMFSQFYVNPFEENVKKFQDSFKSWYSRELMPLYPKYGIYGYDVATFTLKQLGHRNNLYSQSFCDNFINLDSDFLQTDINLTQDSEVSCLQNRGLYLIHFAPDATITKHVIR